MHGSNRLGTNSLLDINVFGRRAGIAAAEYADAAPTSPSCRPNPAAAVVEHGRADCATPPAASGSPTSARRCRRRWTPTPRCTAPRTTLKQALTDIAALKERYRKVVVQDKGQRFNTDLLEAVELGFLLELAEVLVVGALARNESRGGHVREDYPTRDDVNFMRHTMAYRERPRTDGADIRLDYKPVVETRYQPMERKY